MAAEQPVTEQPVTTKRFQLVTLNGQVKDKPGVLGQIATKLSTEKLTLVVFGNPSDTAVKAFTEKCVALLRKLAGHGYETALLQIDTTFYKTGPVLMLDERERPFVNPSVLVYVNGLQLHYVKEFSNERIDFIETAILLSHRKFKDRK